MALKISEGSGATVATEQIASLHYGWNKIAGGQSQATVGWIIDSGANASGAGHVFLRGNITLSDPTGFIGLVTIGGMSSVTLSDPKGYIGLVTATMAGGNATITPMGQYYNQSSLVSLGSGAFGPFVVDQYGRQVMGTGLANIGFATVNLVNSPNVSVVGNITLSDPKGYIGLVSIAQPISTTFSGNVTLDPGSKTAIVGNVTLSDPKTFIGLTTTVDARPILTSLNTVAGYLSTSSGYPQLVTPQFQSGNRWAETGTGIGQVALIGNVTLSDSKTFIGSVSVGGIVDSKGYIGLVTVGGIGTVTLADPKGFIGSVSIGGIVDSKGYIGLVTTTPSAAWPDPKTYIGLVTIGGIGTITLSDPKGYIGLVTAVFGRTDILNINNQNALFVSSASGTMMNTIIRDGSGNVVGVDGTSFGLFVKPVTNSNYIGLITVGGIGTVTLADPKGFIGLVTIVPTYISTYTSLSTILSANGLATIIVPPTGKTIVVKDIHVSSLGRAEVSLWDVNSSVTISRIPWTSLSTTGGFIHNYGDGGHIWGSSNDGLTVVLNGAATIGVMFNVRFQ